MNMSDMSKDEWAQKDRRIRASIEGQVALKELGESLRAGLWKGEDAIYLLERYTQTIKSIMDEWDKANNIVPLKPDSNKIPDDIMRLTEQGKTICHVLKLDWQKELDNFAASRKASTKPYPSRILLESLITELQRKENIAFK